MTQRRLFLAAALLFARALSAQQPMLMQQMQCVKVNPGKNSEWRQLVLGYTGKIAQTRVNSGELRSWSLLRSIEPAGEEARCTFMMSSIGEVTAFEPPSPEVTRARREKAGITMPAEEFSAKLQAISKLVSTELWRVRQLSGAAKKGDYVRLGYKKIKEMGDYLDHEQNVWKPMAEDWIQNGAMSSWVVATKAAPAGTDAAYPAYSADVFPSWKTLWAQRNIEGQFGKVHPGKSFSQVWAKLIKIHEVGRSEILVFEERFAK